MPDPAKALPPGPGGLTVSQQDLINSINNLSNIIGNSSLVSSSPKKANTGTLTSRQQRTNTSNLDYRTKEGISFRDAQTYGTEDVKKRAGDSAENYKLTRRLSAEIDSIHNLIGSLENQTKFFEDQRKNKIALEASDALLRRNRFKNELKGMQKFQMLLMGNVGFAKNIYVKQMKELGKELVETKKVKRANRAVLEGIDKEIGYQKANQDVVSAIEDKFGYVGKLFGGFKNASADKEEMLTENKGILAEKLKSEENKARARDRLKKAKPGSSEYKALTRQLAAYDEQDQYDRNPVMDESDARVYKESIGAGANRDGSKRGGKSVKTKKGKIKPSKTDILKPDALPGEQTLFLTNALGITEGKRQGKGGLLGGGGGDSGDNSSTGGPFDFLADIIPGGLALAAAGFKGLKNKFFPNEAQKAAKLAKDTAKVEAKAAKEAAKAAAKAEARALPRILQGLSKFGIIGKMLAGIGLGATGLAANPGVAKAVTSALRLNSAGRVINSSGKFASAAEAAAFKASQAAENAATSGLRLNSAGRVINSSGKFASAAEAAAFKASQAAENAGSKAVGSGLKGASKFLGKGLPFLGPLLQAGFTADEIYEIQKNNDLTAEQKAIQTESAAAGGVGSLVGGGIGAAIGTVLLGPLGTVLGGMAGSFFGESLARLISENRDRGPAVTNQQVLAASGLPNKQVGPNGIIKNSFTTGLGQLSAADVVKAKEDEYYRTHPERKRPVMGDTFEDAYIESNGTIHQKDPRDKILFFQDPNTIEIVKNTKSAAKQENMSGSPLSNDTMEELLKSILKELKFSNNKKTPAPKMDILGGKNLLMGNM